MRNFLRLAVKQPLLSVSILTLFIYSIGSLTFFEPLGWNFPPEAFSQHFAKDLFAKYSIRIIWELITVTSLVAFFLSLWQRPLKFLAILPIVIYASYFQLSYYDAYLIRFEEAKLIKEHGSMIEGRVFEYFNSSPGTKERKKVIARFNRLNSSDFESEAALRAMKYVLGRGDIPLIQLFIDKGTEWNWSVILKESILNGSHELLKHLLNKKVIDHNLQIDGREVIWFAIDQDNWEATKALYQLGFKDPFSEEIGFHLGMYAVENSKTNLINGTNNDPFLRDMRPELGSRIGGQIKRYLQSTSNTFMIAGDFVNYAATPTHCPGECPPGAKCVEMKFDCFAVYGYDGKLITDKSGGVIYDIATPNVPWRSRDLKRGAYYTIQETDGEKFIVKKHSSGKFDKKFKKISFYGKTIPQVFQNETILILRRGQILEKYSTKGKRLSELKCPLALNDRIVTFAIGKNDQIALLSERRERGKTERNLRLLNRNCRGKKNDKLELDPAIDLQKVTKISALKNSIALATSLKYVGGKPIPPLVVVNRAGLLQEGRTKEIKEAIEKALPPKCEPEDRIHFSQFSKPEDDEHKYVAKLHCGEGGYGLDFELSLDSWI